MELQYEILYSCFVLGMKYLEYNIPNNAPDCANLKAPFSIMFNWLFLLESLNAIEYGNELLRQNILIDPYNLANLSYKIFNSLTTYEFVNTSDYIETISPKSLEKKPLILCTLALTVLALIILINNN